MKINVTLKHISEGKPNCAPWCPIALAIQEATGLPGSVGCTIYFVDNRAYMSSPEMKQFVDRFDRGLPVEPFTFEVPIAVATN